MLRIRLPGKLGQAVRSGYLTTTARPAGQITWREYLAERPLVGTNRIHCSQASAGHLVRASRAEPAGPGRATGRPAAADVRPAGNQGPHHRPGQAEPGYQRTGGDQFWIVAEHGRSAQYVRDLEADPRVRVRVGSRWRTGTARILDDDALARARWMSDSLGPLHKADALVARLTATTPLTIRLDLD